MRRGRVILHFALFAFSVVVAVVAGVSGVCDGCVAFSCIGGGVAVSPLSGRICIFSCIGCNKSGGG